jgi:glycosyltransferase involved in cell wall biosynthesis
MKHFENYYTPDIDTIKGESCAEQKLKIFISAFACEPNWGSEPGVGWHWVLEMSKHFDLWVLTRKNHVNLIENWINQNPQYEGIKFLYYDLPFYHQRSWRKGPRGIRTYYNIWQWRINTIVKQTMQENDIQIFHHLTYGNAIWKVCSYGQKQYFIWGPVGGAETIPAEYSQYYKIKSRLFEWVRRLVVNTLPINKGFKQRCQNADLILCKTEATLNNIPKQYKKKAILFTDVAVEIKDNPVFPITDRKESDIIRYLAVGRLDGWRGFDLLIEAFAKAIKKNTNISLEILGNGMERDRLQKLIDGLTMNACITLSGNVPMSEYYEKLAACNVVVNPCLKEGAVTTAFDSLSFGKPLICIDTGGYTRYFNKDHAIIISRKSREEVVNALQDAILELTNEALRNKFGRKALEIARRNTWENKGEEIYQTIIERYVENSPK